MNSLPVTFNYDAITARLSKLQPIRRLIFAATCAERAFSLYGLHFEMTGFGKPEQLRATLDQLWNLAETEVVGTHLEFLDIAPSLVAGNQWSIAGQLAENAVSCLHAACRVEVSGDSKDAMRAAYSGYEAVEYLGQLLLEPYAPGTRNKQVREWCDAWIYAKPFVQRELLRQERDLLGLETSQVTPLQQLAKEFRDRAARETHDLYAIAKDVIREYKRMPNTVVDTPWWASQSPGSPPDIATNISVYLEG